MLVRSTIKGGILTLASGRRSSSTNQKSRIDADVRTEIDQRTTCFNPTIWRVYCHAESFMLEVVTILGI
jgi:hypothetical protein